MNDLLIKTKTFLSRNASTILTCVGGVGVVATTVLAIKATPKAMARVKEAEEEKGEKLTKFEIVKTTGTAYIPTVLAGVSTLTCIFGANALNKRQQATLVSAYALLDNSYKEYKKKVDELYGEEAGKEVRAGITKDKYTGDKVLLEDNEELFYDFYSGRFFNSTREAVLKAEYETNRTLYTVGYVGVNDFYEYLGIDPRPEYNDIGWTCGQLESSYWHSWIDFDHDKTVMDDEYEDHEGLECTIIHMPYEPVIDAEYY